MLRNIQLNIIDKKRSRIWVRYNNHNIVVATKRNRLVTSNKRKGVNMEADLRVSIHEILRILEVIEDEPKIIADKLNGFIYYFSSTKIFYLYQLKSF